MIFGMNPAQLETWEMVAAVQMMQLPIWTRPVETNLLSHTELFGYAGISAHSSAPWDEEPVYKVEFGNALREVEKTAKPYCIVLAEQIGVYKEIRTEAGPPRFPAAGIAPSEGGPIVLCPFAFTGAFNIPQNVWKAVTRHLRSSGAPVTLMGEPQERMDIGNFTEGAILSRLSLYEKMQVLASAKVVVGVPNAWTWMASAWSKKVIIFYPDGIPVERWYGFYNERSLGRVLYQPSAIQIPLMLAGLRKLFLLM